MQPHRKIVVASQHYPPDPSTTAAIMDAIARRLACEHDVVVLSGTPGLWPEANKMPGQPVVKSIKNTIAPKAALVRRATAEIVFAIRIFLALLRELNQGDVVLTVTAPFMLPYAVAVAARLKRARSVLILHDLFPDVLVIAGLLKPGSLVAKAIRVANAWMFRYLSAIITIGRDVDALLLSYRGMAADKIRFIPNWATLVPGLRPVNADNPFRRTVQAPFVVGLSGNLGFTHDPDIVFEAARLLRNEKDIHFLLSGWGIGFERLRHLQAHANLPNISFAGRVEDAELESLLTAADIWIIPYRENVAGVSVPSRFYNLLAVGRPVVLVSEPAAEAALTLREHGLGWVVKPGRPDELADAIMSAFGAERRSIAERAIEVAGRFDRESAMDAYAKLMTELLEQPDLVRQR